MNHFAFRLMAILLVGWNAYAATPAKVVGQLGMIEGDVQVDGQSVKKSATVKEGSVIEVKKGKATLILGKGSVFYIGADSKMVVNQFGIKPADPGQPEQETGSLDLKFGRTRALIMNTGNEKKDLKIRARAATMGVRGTEIFIDSPRDSNKPINFFTLEGKADLQVHDRAPPVAVNQGEGVSTRGEAPPPAAGGGGTQGGNASQGGGAQGSGTQDGGSQTTAGGNAPPAAGSAPAPATMTMQEVKNEIRAVGLGSGAINTPQDMRRQVTQQYMSDQFGMGALPPLVLDPLQDRFTPVKLQPRWCDATTGNCP